MITKVEDPNISTEPFYTSTQFKRERNGDEVAPDGVPHPAAAGRSASGRASC